jgi:tetratricopeptide (TPR) repeat protein
MIKRLNSCCPLAGCAVKAGAFARVIISTAFAWLVVNSVMAQTLEPVATTSSGAYLIGVRSEELGDMGRAARAFKQVAGGQSASSHVRRRALFTAVLAGDTAVLAALAARKEEFGRLDGFYHLWALIPAGGAEFQATEAIMGQVRALADRDDELAGLFAMISFWMGAEDIELQRPEAVFAQVLASATDPERTLVGEAEIKAALPRWTDEQQRLIALVHARRGDWPVVEAVLAAAPPSQTTALWLSQPRAAAQARDPVLAGSAPTQRQMLAALFINHASQAEAAGNLQIALILAQLGRAMDPSYLIGHLETGLLAKQLGLSPLATDAYEQAVTLGAEMAAKDKLLAPLHWFARMQDADLRASASVTNADRAAVLADLKMLAAERPQMDTIWRRLGDQLRAMERYEESEAAYTKVIERVEALDSRLLFARAVSRHLGGDWPGAEADLQAALVLQPEDPLMLNYLGYSWIERGIHIDEGTDMIKRALAQRPEAGFIIDSLGWAYYQTGRYQDAVIELERALEVDPGNDEINDHLGDAYWQLGREREAVYQWRRALNFTENEERAEQIHKKLDRGL